MDEDDLTPSGSEITGVGVRQQGGFISGFGSILLDGLGRFVDAELPLPTKQPDTAEVDREERQRLAPPGTAGFFDNVTPLQVGGLLVAGGLTIALVTGQFRPGP